MYLCMYAAAQAARDLTSPAPIPALPRMKFTHRQSANAPGRYWVKVADISLLKVMNGFYELDEIAHDNTHRRSHSVPPSPLQDRLQASPVSGDRNVDLRLFGSRSQAVAGPAQQSSLATT